MNRKVIDILPPQKIEEKKAKEFQPRIEREAKFRRPGFKIRLPLTRKKILTSGLLILILIFLCVGTVGYFNLSKTDIEIWPEAEIMNFETKLVVDKKTEQIDFLNKVIPGKVFKKEKIFAENFPSSGKTLKEEKAEGTIRAYNAYSTYTQILIATTRFVSTDGKVFRTPIRVTIPGGHYEKGKLVPGEIDIRVVAAEAGPEYNIGPSTFSIPGFAGTDRYTKFYAKSFQPMEGGFSEEIFQVTKEDLEKAEDILIKKAKEECESFFINELQSDKISSEFNFLEDAIQTKILETFSSAKNGTELESFNFQVKAESETLLFKKEDLENFAKKFILSQVPEGKKIHEEQLEINYLPENINLNAGKIILSLNLEAKIYSGINENNLKKGLRGKSLKETQVLLEGQPEIIKVQIKLWPFWVKQLPDDVEKIKFKLNLD